MKIAAFALTAASAAVVLAQPHNHGHRHVHEHNKRDVTVTSWAPGPTDYVFVLNGQEISAQEVCAGIEDNELKFVDDSDPGVCASLVATTSSTTSTTTTTSSPPTTTPAAETTSAPAEFYQAPGASAAWGGSSAGSGGGFGGSSSSPPSWGSSAPASQPSSPASSWPSSGGGSGVGAAFPDGQLDCSAFPSEYGAVAVDYLGMGGWSGLQQVTIAGGFVTHIVTGISGQSCTEGMMCSYACPPGYQKSQWPSTQGSTGQSVGGISCSGGKLHLTNPSLSSSLCVAGVGNVQATNNANGVVAICRTDYPGTESETVPVELQPGQSQPLTVPDAASYYEWQGQSTSAQYYLNPIGYGASQACQWGTPGTPLGNYAPMNFGVGAKGGVTYISMFPNQPTTSATFEGSVEIQGNISGSCKYSNGQYCSSTGCSSTGCTVSLDGHWIGICANTC